MEYSSDLKLFLDEFVDAHRGVRLGKMFGMPALYAGRRLFACVSEDGLVVRIPADIVTRERRNGAKPFSQAPASSDAKARSQPAARRTHAWLVYRPRTIVAARRLIPVLEIAARDVARKQVEEMTGVRLR